MHFPRILLLFSSLACVADCTAFVDNAKALSELKILGAEATAFCSSFLGIPKKTVIAATVTPVVTVTATSIISTIIRVGKRSAPSPAPGCIFGLPCAHIQRRVNHPVPAALVPFGPPGISFLCSLLHVTPAVTTITITATPTTTTTSTTTTSTTTVTRQNCDADATHNFSGNGTGNTVVFVVAVSPADCCQKCQTTLNCIANAVVGAGQCQFLVKTTALAGAVTSAMCPLGIAGYPFGPSVAGAFVYKGPCG